MASLLFTNLKLLGLDALEMEAKYRTPFNSAMFNVPNKAGSEAVLHFLFNRWNPALFKQQFRDCWPVIDRRAEKEFRKICHSWLSTIQTENPEAHLPRNNASLLLSPGGPKYIKLLYKFSTFVMRQIIEKEHGFDMQLALMHPTASMISSGLGAVTKATIEDSIQQYQEEYFDLRHSSVAANKKYKQTADELVKSIRRVNTKEPLQEKRQLVNSLAESASKQGLALPVKRTLDMFDSNKDVTATRRAQRMDQAQSYWEQINQFSCEMEEKRKVVKAVLDPDIDKPAVNGTALGVSVPNILLMDFKKDTQKQVISSNQVNLESLVQVWHKCLHSYKKQLSREKFPDLSTTLPSTNQQVQLHQVNLQEVKKLREDVNKLLPKLQRKMEKVQESLRKSLLAADDNNKNGSLSLTAPTPPLTAHDRLQGRSAMADTPVVPISSNRIKKDTPTAISSVQSIVEGGVQARLQSSASSDNYFSSRLQAMTKSTSQTPLLKTKLPNKKKAPWQTKQKNGGSVSVKKPDVQQKINHLSSESATAADKMIRSLDHLVDTVVDSVMESESAVGDDNLDFLCSNFQRSYSEDLDRNAFVSKDLLQHSPISSARSNISTTREEKSDGSVDTSIYKGWQRGAQNSPASNDVLDIFSPFTNTSGDDTQDYDGHLIDALDFVSPFPATSNSKDSQSTEFEVSPQKHELLDDELELDKITTSLLVGEERGDEDARTPGDGELCHDLLVDNGDDDDVVGDDDDDVVGDDEYDNDDDGDDIDDVDDDNIGDNGIDVDDDDDDDEVIVKHSKQPTKEDSFLDLHIGQGDDFMNNLLGSNTDKTCRSDVSDIFSQNGETEEGLIDLSQNALTIMKEDRLLVDLDEPPEFSEFEGVSNRDLLGHQDDDDDEDEEFLTDAFTPLKMGIIFDHQKSSQGDNSSTKSSRARTLFSNTSMLKDEEPRASPYVKRFDHDDADGLDIQVSPATSNLSTSKNDIASRLALLRQKWEDDS